MSPYRVTIDPSTTYQTVDGFGPAITGATCYNLLQMSQADRTAILRKCFDLETGAGFSFIRVHIGGSGLLDGQIHLLRPGGHPDSSPFPPWRRMASFRC